MKNDTLRAEGWSFVLNLDIHCGVSGAGLGTPADPDSKVHHSDLGYASAIRMTCLCQLSFNSSTAVINELAGFECTQMLLDRIM